MHCTNCAAEVPEQRKFCGLCGAAVVRRCVACGAVNPALNKFCGDCGTKLRVDSLAAAPTAPDSRPIERRQLTVLFCDLVGSTALSAGLDPEDFGAIIAGYRRCITETVACFDGFVARHHGDGAVVYFGYPHAHEDDPERAVQASLAIVEAVAALPAKEKLSARIGVATGVALVGDMSDSAISEEHGILGDTPNLAARLQSLAQPGAVVISGRTKTIAGPQFEYLDLGKVEIKGLAKPVAAWQVAGKTAVTSRSHALQSSDLLPLIGRDEEMELILSRWKRARSGEGQVVLLSGEAGIGKSRLAVALLEQLAREPHIRLRCFCSPQHTDSTLYPVIGETLRAARFAHDDSQQVKMDKLDALLAQSSTPPQDAALFAEMLSLPNDGRYPPVEVEPQLRRQKTLKALGSQLEALARINPVLVIFEDAHWADPTSLELFARAVDLAVSHRLLILVTFRPEFSPSLTGRPHVTELTLHRLAPCDIDFLIERVVGNRSLPAGVRRDIIERTDGIPLFAEEMTKAVLDAEGESDAQRAFAAGPTPVVAVPASLQASLMSRLDRLGPAKNVAQVGAAIGRAFPHMLLAALVRKKEELDSDLDRLIAAGLLFRHGTPPHASYLFKHALVQDVAYSTLLREPRRALHARIAEILESQFPEIAESQPELLARHCTKADLIEKSARLWGKAGQRSQERSALVEAAEQLGQALEQIETLPSTSDLRREQIILQVALLNTLMHVKGYGAPETKAAVAQVRALIEQAERLGEPPDDPSLLLSALFGQWIVNFINFNGDVARELAARFLVLGEKEGAAVPLMIGHRTMASTLALVGDIVEARAHYNEALALYRPAEHRRLMTRFGQDLRVTCLAFRSMASWLLGYPEAALDDADCALAEARQIDHAATLMFTLNFPILVNTYCGNYDAANEHLEELVVLAEQKGAPFRKAEGVLRRGYILTLTGEATKAVEIVTSGIDLWRSAGSTIFTPEQEFMLAIAHADSGQFDDAWRCIDEAMTAMHATKERWCEAEAHRVAGEIALKSPQRDVAKAQACFERSLILARAQQAKSWELRAAMSLARLLSDQGKRQTARDLLAPIYDWFTEGFDTSDLRKAKALLSDLH
ncbi:AAA family ATPase [Bradyrhizobium sp. SRL28]|uniref:adenylate/guanylate cyclase domain-containing protein n=1 Tax=Bradyrhizobium sp. SRL28 TaxID=2836178 RepID=UPI001BDE97AF|nr:adenylate/guanylate cyclase domain-containing protein [Bradyrhizobium sp. SRL28]MBT1510234.1 AAA family ATPase [Bradyrhizobium sp. SRL28]